MDREGPDLPARAVESAPGRRTERRQRVVSALLSAAILLAGCSGSLLSAASWRSYVEGQSVRAFTGTASTAADALGVALQRDDDLTSTARTLVETAPTLDNARLGTWFRLLGTPGNFPGSFGLTYIESVSPGGLATFERQAAKDPPFGIPLSGRFSVVPRSPGTPYCLTRAGVVQIAPGVPISIPALSKLLVFTAPDLNYCALPIGRLLQESARTGQEAVTTIASLIKTSPHEPGMPVMPKVLPVFFQKNALAATITPIYRGGTSPATPAARVASLQGWVFEIYAATSILQSVLRGHHDSAAVLTYVNPTGHRMLLASFGRHAPGSLSRTFRLATAGHWLLTLSAVPPVSGLPPGDQAVAILVAGFLLSFLLYILVRVLTRSRRKALDLADERSAQLRHQALHDNVTDLPNRDLIVDRAEQMLARARRDCTIPAALFVDLDNFKDVNDAFGHDVGDTLLREVAARLSSNLRETDTVGRIGGDDFVVLVETAPASPGPEYVAEKLIAALEEPFTLGVFGGELRSVSATVGIAVGLRDSAGELLRDADMALSQAKGTARGGYVVFDPEMQTALAARLGLEADLHSAVRNGEFFLVYQPLFSLSDDAVTGVEALLRWQHPVRGTVLPAEFIGALEQTGLILDVGRFVLEEACRQAELWARAGFPLSVSVNVSARQLDREDFVSLVEEALTSSGLNPRLLTIEVTETTLMRDVSLSAFRLRSLKELGVNVAIDDFGTGYCSLAYLQQLPVDCLKIDRSFVAQMEFSAEGAVLVRTIVQMAKDLNLQTVAEGIETPAQLARLRSEECTSGQGFLLAKPLAASAVTARLETASAARPLPSSVS